MGHTLFLIFIFITSEEEKYYIKLSVQGSQNDTHISWRSFGKSMIKRLYSIIWYNLSQYRCFLFSNSIYEINWRSVIWWKVFTEPLLFLISYSSSFLFTEKNQLVGFCFYCKLRRYIAMYTILCIGGHTHI